MEETPAPDAAPDDGAPRPAWTQSGASQPGTPPNPYDQTPPAASTGTDSFFASVRRAGLVRSDERWIGGVAGGIALRLGIDPLIVRGLFGIGALLGGVGLVLYGVGWLLMPEQRDGRIHLQQLLRGDFDAAVIGGIALLLLGFAYPNQWHWFGASSGSGWFASMVGLVAIATIVALIISSRGRGRPAGPSTTLRPGGPQYPATAPVPPAAARRPEGPTMYPAPPAPGHPTGPAPAYAPHPAAGPWTSGPWAAAPPYRPRNPAVPTTTLPRTRADGPGGRALGVVVALGLILLAALLLAERRDAFDGPVMLTVAAAVVIMCGLGIALAGARGRRSGGLGAVAIITILIVAPVTAATDLRFDGTGMFVGEGTYTPRTVATAEDGYSWTFGDVTVDLTEVPDGSTVTVPLHLGAGDLLVVVPEGAAVTAEVRQGAGDVSWLDETQVSGVGNDRRTFTSRAAEDGATPDIELDISMGAGSLTVVEG